MATSDPGRWEDRISRWTSKYKEAEQVHEEARKYYDNQFPRGLITVNLVFSFGRSMVPQLYFKNPSVTVLIKGENSDLSRLLQEVDVELIRQMKLKKTIKKMIVSSYLTGRGIGKLGFADGDEPRVFDPSGMVKPNQPWFLHVLTKNWAHEITPNGDIDDVPWAAMKVTLSKGEVEDDDRIRGKAKEDATNTQDDDATFDFWEVWDRGEGEFGLLYNDEWARPPGTFTVWPFYGLEFNWVPEEPIPVSDAELILQLQKEYNENETQIHEHRRTSVLRMIAKKGAFDPSEKDKLEKGVVGIVVEAQVTGPISEAITALTPGIPESLLLAKKTLQDDVRDVIGFSRNQIGEFQGSASSRRTFGEAAIVQQALQIRLDERRDMVAELIEHVTHAANQLVFKAWDAADAKRYAGVEEGWDRLTLVERDDYTITVVPDSTLPLTKAIQQQQAIQLYQNLRGDPLIEQVELRREFLRAFEGVDPDKLLNPQAVAMLKQNPQLQTMLLQGAQGAQGQTGVPQPKAPRNGGIGRRAGVA